MQLLDELLAHKLLTPEQGLEIGDWVRQARTPERILQMPPDLWRALETASALLDAQPSGHWLH